MQNLVYFQASVPDMILKFNVKKVQNSPNNSTFRFNLKTVTVNRKFSLNMPVKSSDRTRTYNPVYENFIEKKTRFSRKFQTKYQTWTTEPETATRYNVVSLLTLCKAQVY